MIQEKFLDLIKNQINVKVSFTEKIATILDISYDAAHRRINNKSKISLEEAIVLAKHFNISIDQLFSNIEEHTVVVKKTAPVKNMESLLKYYKNSYDSLVPLINNKQVEIIYSAKDLPIFYTSNDNMLSKFKMYVWLKIMDADLTNTTFINFNPSLSLLEAAKHLGNLYNDLNTVEIWDLTTINSTLKQIHFYYESGMLTIDDALVICDNLKELICFISKKVIDQKEKFKLYHNELLLMNNRVLVKTPTERSLYVPFTILSYYRTNDVNTCNQAEEFLNIQMNGSKLLSAVGERERNLFFNKMNKKVDTLKSLISSTNSLEFQ